MVPAKAASPSLGFWTVHDWRGALVVCLVDMGAIVITVVLMPAMLCVAITDDGHGGADERGGSGLAGIRRRVEAHDGTFALTSPPGGPTTLTVSLPCGS